MPLERTSSRYVWRKSWELQDEQIEAGLARDDPEGTLIGRDEGRRVSRKLSAIGDHHTAGDEQVLSAAICGLRQSAGMAGAQAIEPTGKSIGFHREHGLDDLLAGGLPDLRHWLG